MCDSDCGKGVKLLSGPFNWYSTWFSGVEPKIHFPKVGESATFTCNATGIPSQNFTWTKLGSKVEIINDSRHSVDFLTGSSVLTIKIITVEDQAYYICNATVDDDQQNLGLAYLQLVSGKLYHVLLPKISKKYGMIFVIDQPVGHHSNIMHFSLGTPTLTSLTESSVTVKSRTLEGNISNFVVGMH